MERATKYVAEVVGLGGAQRFGYRLGNQQAPVADAAESGGGLGFDDADDAQFLFARGDAEAFAGVCVRICRRRGRCGFWRERFALGVAQDNIFADQSGGLRREIAREFDLQDGFVRRRAGEKAAFDSFEGAVAAGGIGDARDHRGIRIVVVAHFGHEANLRIDFDDARKFLERMARVVIERRRGALAIRGGGRAEGAEICARSNQDGIEKAGARQSLAG